MTEIGIEDFAKVEMKVGLVLESKRVEGADVLLITEQHPAKVPLKFVLIQTDAEGIAIFKSVKEWKMENLIIHGIQNYSWSMCVSKAGYGTVDNIALSDFPSQKINVVLKKTEYVSGEKEREFFHTSLAALPAQVQRV